METIMKLNIANNSPLRPSMHGGYRRRVEQLYPDEYKTGGERLHKKQPKTISQILRGKGNAD